MFLVSSRKKSGKYIETKSHRERKVTGKGRRECLGHPGHSKNRSRIAGKCSSQEQHAGVKLFSWNSLHIHPKEASVYKGHLLSQEITTQKLY